MTLQGIFCAGPPGTGHRPRPSYPPRSTFLTDQSQTLHPEVLPYIHWRAPTILRELYTKVHGTSAFSWRSCNPSNAWFSRLVHGASGSNPGLESRALFTERPSNPGLESPCRLDGNVVRRVYVGVDVVLAPAVRAVKLSLRHPGVFIPVPAFVACRAGALGVPCVVPGSQFCLPPAAPLQVRCPSKKGLTDLTRLMEPLRTREADRDPAQEVASYACPVCACRRISAPDP